MSWTRRQVLRGLAAGAAGWAASAPAWTALGAPRPYRGRRVIVVRFGGGVRRHETIADPAHTWSPYLLRELAPRGVFYPLMEIAESEDHDTNHSEGTLTILTGRYDKYRDFEGRPFRNRYEPRVPTIFEYLRKTWGVPEHQALIVNGENRPNEEFYSFSDDHLHGVRYRARVLSRHRLRTHVLRRQLDSEALDDGERRRRQRELEELLAEDYRDEQGSEPAALTSYWDSWTDHFGTDGLRQPRGDALITELAVRALGRLRPRLLLLNYQDPDYVHWGNANHYYWGIRRIDEGLQRLVETVQSDEELRAETVFVVVPDCGRGSNPLIPVPFQHHFPSRPSREIFALVFGAGVPRGRVIDRVVDQTAIAGTVGRIMGFETAHSETAVLEEALG